MTYSNHFYPGGWGTVETNWQTIIQEELNNWPSITPTLRLSKAGDSVPPDKSGLHTKTPQHPHKKLP